MKKILFLAVALLGFTAQAQLTSILERFDNFVVDKTGAGGNYGDLPQFGWSASEGWPRALVSQTLTGNKYLKAYSFMQIGVPVYFFSPEVVSTEGKIYFSANTSGGTMEMGVISDPNDLSTFVKLYETVPSSTIRYEVDVPANTAKYFAFKYIPSGDHTVFGIDNINFQPTVLATSEEKKANNNSILYDRSMQSIIITNHSVKNLKIYSSAGYLLLNQDKPAFKVDVSTFGRGMYHATIEKKDGQVESIKFLK